MYPTNLSDIVVIYSDKVLALGSEKADGPLYVSEQGLLLVPPSLKW